MVHQRKKQYLVYQETEISYIEDFINSHDDYDLVSIVDGGRVAPNQTKSRLIVTMKLKPKKTGWFR